MTTILCIIMTEAEAQSVAGESSPGAILAPRMLADGVTWILPARVLSSPEHSSKWAVLSTFPQREVDFSEFPPDSPEDV